MTLTIVGAIDASQNNVQLSGKLDAQPGDLFRLDDEVVTFGGHLAVDRQHAVSLSLVSLARGQEGTTAATHISGTELLGAVEAVVSGEATAQPAPFPAGGAAMVPWTDFDPVWTSSGEGQPDVGDGELIGKYLAVPAAEGQWTVDYLIQVNYGSTTDPGEGDWIFAPPPFTDDPTPFFLGVGSISIAVESDTTAHCGLAVNAGNEIQPYGPDGETRVDATHPFAWDPGSVLNITGRYLGVAD